MSVFILVHVTQSGSPALNLVPSISVWRLSDLVQVVTDQAMSALGNGAGGYVFDFTPFFDPGQEYSFSIDADDASPPAGLTPAERFLFGSSDDFLGDVSGIGFSDTILEVTFTNPVGFSDTVLEVDFISEGQRGVNLLLMRKSRWVEERQRSYQGRQPVIQPKKDRGDLMPRQNLDKVLLRKPSKKVGEGDEEA